MPKDENLKLTAKEVAASLDGVDYPPVLTIEQAAELLQMPVGTLRDWRSRGLLDGCSRKIGKRVRFFRDRLILHVFNGGLDT